MGTGPAQEAWETGSARPGPDTVPRNTGARRLGAGAPPLRAWSSWQAGRGRVKPGPGARLENGGAERCGRCVSSAWQAKDVWQARRGIAKHVADVRILGADRNRHTKTPQTTQRGSGSKGADVCGRLVFERGPTTEAARTCKGYARIAPDVPPATTELQRFKWKHRCGRAGCGRRGGQAKVYINSIVRGCGGT